jgi:hypothetical protein
MVPGKNIARFDGTTWHPLGTGINGQVRALCVFDPDGPGPHPDLLIAGGNFSVAGGQQAWYIAAWDGQSWSPLGPGTSKRVNDLEVWGDKLAVAGWFLEAGGYANPYVARWGCGAPPFCYADCNPDGILDVVDLGCFQNRFLQGNPYADCDGNGFLNLLDFDCFITKFLQGCP